MLRVYQHHKSVLLSTGESGPTDRRLLPPYLLRRHIKNPGFISRIDNAPIVNYVIEAPLQKAQPRHRRTIWSAVAATEQWLIINCSCLTLQTSEPVLDSRAQLTIMASSPLLRNNVLSFPKVVSRRFGLEDSVMADDKVAVMANPLGTEIVADEVASRSVKVKELPLPDDGCSRPTFAAALSATDVQSRC
ncbi:hypothetical protein HPB50_008200 [Hyalomma asiaticum]|uniref:Uncharacterized protein n=1 Tax=Hyalomma asiaticum TaxID=266040 RepID=A0ACB7S4S4_HYAAI|nr:hypothetical protein HPB50_008200 [Hyalomma asiaticum]